MEKDKVILGSGHLYIAETVETGVVPENIFDEANNVGSISGGAELNYTPTIYDVVDDDDKVLKSFITKEEVILKSGVLTWLLESVAKLSAGGKYDSASKTLTIGGKKSVKQYAVGFRHEEDDGYKLEVTMVGRSNKGFVINFNKEKETIIDAEFKAIKDNDGILVTIKETEAVTEVTED